MNLESIKNQIIENRRYLNVGYSDDKIIEDLITILAANKNMPEQKGI